MSDRDTIDYLLEKIAELEGKVNELILLNSYKPKIVHKFKRLTDTAKAPSKSNTKDCGWDLYADEDVDLPFGVPVKIKTGIAFGPEVDHHGLVWDRSSMGIKGVKVLGGLIDNQDRGEVSIILENIQEGSSYTIQKGQKITQIFFVNIPENEMVEDELDETVRSSNGFGSTGNF